jgi:hypothetical protein
MPLQKKKKNQLDEFLINNTIVKMILKFDIR